MRPRLLPFAVVTQWPLETVMAPFKQNKFSVRARPPGKMGTKARMPESLPLQALAECVL
jgi:hypothetical protein